MESEPRVTYDTALFTEAHRKFIGAASELTDAEIAQFDLVDRKLGDRARAKREGFVEPGNENEAERKIGSQPLSVGMFLKQMRSLARDHIGPTLKTHVYRIRQAHTRIDALEARLSDPKDAAGELLRAEERIKSLEARVEELSRRPAIEYIGVHESGKTYAPGNLVTLGGAMWIAMAATSARPGDGATGWKLCVKAGRDGKDLR